MLPDFGYNLSECFSLWIIPMQWDHSLESNLTVSYCDVGGLFYDAVIPCGFNLFTYRANDAVRSV